MHLLVSEYSPLVVFPCSYPSLVHEIVCVKWPLSVHNYMRRGLVRFLGHVGHDLGDPIRFALILLLRFLCLQLLSNEVQRTITNICSRGSQVWCWVDAEHCRVLSTCNAALSKQSCVKSRPSTGETFHDLTEECSWKLRKHVNWKFLWVNWRR